jgi:hypothetical protein
MHTSVGRLACTWCALGLDARAASTSERVRSGWRPLPVPAAVAVGSKPPAPCRTTVE